MDCGATCLAMITKFYGKSFSVQHLRESCYATREGVSLLSIGNATEKLGMHTMGVHMSFEQLAKDAQLPCIVHWKQNHFVV
ncbi:hypothetical protein FACS1894178_1610 [Bacteroidia bacterium]|nr:hypothetical protein FACS1894178_1610 [Bacteroidia bacterium]